MRTPSTSVTREQQWTKGIQNKAEKIAKTPGQINTPGWSKSQKPHQDTSKWVEATQEGPLFIMHHGDPAAVLIGIEAFEELLDRLQLKAELTRQEKQSKGKIPLAELQKRHGL